MTDLSIKLFFSWSSLWRFSHSQIVTYASYMTLLIPLVAQFVLFLQDSSIEIQIPATKELWRIFAVDIYLAGLLLVIGRLLVQLKCPERIQRFPFEDDHFIFIAKIKEDIKRINPTSLPIESGATLEDIFSEAVAHVLGSPESTNEDWKKANTSNQTLRWIIGILYTVGTLGLVAYLVWRAIQNIDHVWRVLFIQTPSLT